MTSPSRPRDGRAVTRATLGGLALALTVPAVAHALSPRSEPGPVAVVTVVPAASPYAGRVAGDPLAY